MSFSHRVSDLVDTSDDGLHTVAAWWSRVPLGEVCDILNGFPFKSQFFNDTHGEPVIRIRDVTSGKSATLYSGEVPKGYWVEPSEIVVGMDGDFNCRMWPSDRGLLNQRVCKLTPDEGFLEKTFLAYALPGYLRLINEHTHSITVKHLSSKTISEIPFPLPPREEQRRIVAKLDSLFERTRRAREDLSHVPLLIEYYKQAILSAAFRGDLTADWRKSNSPAPVTKDPFGIDSRSGPLPSLPSSWTWTSVGSETLVSGGLAKNARRREISTKVPYLRVANVYANELRLDDIQEIGCTPAEFEKTQLCIGDLLVVEGNGSLDQIGRVALWDGSVDDCSHQNHLIRVRAGAEVTPEFLLFWMLSPVGRKYIERVASSSSGLHTLSISKISGLALPFCTIDEMTEITRRIQNFFGHIEGLVAEYGRAAHLLDHLDQANLAKAFRGELVHQDPNDDPASALLDRIRASRTAEPVKRRRRNTVRKAKMTKLTTESLKEIIQKLPGDRFSFDDLRGQVSADYYETLKDTVFALLAEENPSVRQIFDKQAQALRFVRVNS